MGYTIDESLNDTDYTASGSVAGVFGTPRRYESITIHHWGAFGQTHMGVVNFFMRPNSPTSCHLVASDGLIHCLVSPQDASWAAGNAYGNATSIHIECRPEATDGDYATVAWLVAYLRKYYGDLPLKPHNYWANTSCPGNWDLARVDRMARAGTAAPAPAPVKPKPAPAKPAAPKPQGTITRKTYSKNDIHWVVEKGDTLSKIARYYGIPKDAARIAAHNGIKVNSILKVGDRIWIPGPLYWVIEGPDEISSIAAYYGLDADFLARLNDLPNRWATIYVGNTLLIKK